jgi:hypothetical protein
VNKLEYYIRPYYAKVFDDLYWYLLVVADNSGRAV